MLKEKSLFGIVFLKKGQINQNLREYGSVIYAKQGKERESFISFTEYSLGILAEEDYSSFLSLFDSSRVTIDGLVLALKYLDESASALKIDNPARIKNKQQRIGLIALKDGSGYHMDYDLTTNGEINDLTIQIDFLKDSDRYIVILDDLHTL